MRRPRVQFDVVVKKGPSPRSRNKDDGRSLGILSYLPEPFFATRLLFLGARWGFVAELGRDEGRGVTTGQPRPQIKDLPYGASKSRSEARRPPLMNGCLDVEMGLYSGLVITQTSFGAGCQGERNGSGGNAARRRADHQLGVWDLGRWFAPHWAHSARRRFQTFDDGGTGGRQYGKRGRLNGPADHMIQKLY